MTIQEIQDLINNKDWEGLTETTCLELFNFANNGEYKNITFEKDFITEFICDLGLLKKHQEYLKRQHNTDLLWVDVVNCLLERLFQQNITLDIPDWEKWVVRMKSAKNMGMISQSGFETALSLFLKPANYYKMIIRNDKIYKDIVLSIYISTPLRLLPQSFDGLSKDELKQLKDKITLDGKARFGNYDENILLLLMFTLDEIEAIKSDRNHKLFESFRSINLGILMKNMPHDVFLTMIRKKVIEGGGGILKYKGYFDNNLDMEIPQWFLDWIFDPDTLDATMSNQYSVNRNAIRAIINNMTKEQIKKYADYITIDILAQCNNLSLKDISNLKPNEKHDLWGSTDRFFTEEEIAEFPQFFHPYNAKYRYYLYISKDTFKKLNKAWGKRQRYVPELSDFSSICKKLRIDEFIPKNLKYLQGKTGVSNIVVIKAINDRNIENIKHSGVKTLKNFLEKYGD